jgi:hypothetical protein
MWATFQTPYRLSTAYQASVVLMESNIPIRTPLPVLRAAGRTRVADCDCPAAFTGEHPERMELPEQSTPPAPHLTPDAGAGRPASGLPVTADSAHRTCQRPGSTCG